MRLRHIIAARRERLRRRLLEVPNVGPWAWRPRLVWNGRHRELLSSRDHYIWR